MVPSQHRAPQQGSGAGDPTPAQDSGWGSPGLIRHLTRTTQIRHLTGGCSRARESSSSGCTAEAAHAEAPAAPATGQCLTSPRRPTTHTPGSRGVTEALHWNATSLSHAAKWEKSLRQISPQQHCTQRRCGTHWRPVLHHVQKAPIMCHRRCGFQAGAAPVQLQLLASLPAARFIALAQGPSGHNCSVG